MTDMEAELGLKNKEEELVKLRNKLKRRIWLRGIQLFFRILVVGTGIGSALRGVVAYHNGDIQESTYDLLFAILLLQRWGL